MTLLLEQSARDQAIDALHAATAIYTAERVVDDLLDKLDCPRAGRRLVDPSCGDGMFLARALRRLLAVEPAISGARLLDLVEGLEIHPYAAEPPPSTHRWVWRKWLPERHGQACRILATGRMNAALVEFHDGFRVITSRYAVRRIGEEERQRDLRFSGDA